MAVRLCAAVAASAALMACSTPVNSAQVSLVCSEVGEAVSKWRELYPSATTGLGLELVTLDESTGAVRRKSNSADWRSVPAKFTEFKVEFVHPYDILPGTAAEWTYERLVVISRVDGKFWTRPLFKDAEGNVVATETVRKTIATRQLSTWVHMVPPEERGVCAPDNRKF